MRALLILTLALAPMLAAQSYSVSNGTIGAGYADLVSPTPSNLTFGQLSAAISPTGFSFDYFGTTYTSFKLAAGGYMIMGSSGTVISKYASHTTAPGLVIAPDWDYIAPGSSLYPPTSPTLPAPGRCNYTWAGGILEVEWKNCPIYGTPSVGVRMKAILNTTTGVIEFQYGSVPTGCTGSAPAVANCAAISGPTTVSPQEVINASIPGFISNSGAITTYPAGRYVQFAPAAVSNTPPSVTVMQSSSSVTDGGTVNVNHGIPLSALFFAITANDANGDPVSLGANISDLGGTGIVVSEWQSGTAAVPYTLSPATGVFNTAGGVTHTVTLTANDGADVTTFTFDIVQAPATPVPVMAISDGAAISQGQSAAGSNRDFGSIDIGSGATGAATITISNSGTGNLNLGTISMTGDTGHFVLDTSMTSTTVAPSGSTTFTVAFDPTTAGQKIAQVTFTHNDATQTSPFSFEVTGLGTTVAPVPLVVARETSVAGAVIANGAAAAGIRAFGSFDLAVTPTAAVTICVQNAGTATLSLGAPFSTNSDFTVNATGFPGTLAGGNSATFTVSFSPATVGAKLASIQFTHNDASTATPFSFDVTGTATSTVPGTVGGNGGGGGGGCEVSNGSDPLWLLLLAAGAGLGARTLRRRAR